MAGHRFFFQVTVSFYFTKVAAAIHSSMDRVFLKRALTAMTCVYTMYLTGIWKILSKFAIPAAVTHLMNDPFSTIKEQLQPRILLNLLFLHNKSCSKEISSLIIMIPPWFRECIYWMKSVIWRHLLEPLTFSIIVLLFLL